MEKSHDLKYFNIRNRREFRQYQDTKILIFQNFHNSKEIHLACTKL